MTKTAAKRKKILRKQTAAKRRAEGRKISFRRAEPLGTPLSYEAFLSLPLLEGIPAARLETFYQVGIQSVADFAQWTEKELLTMKGIGPATIKQLLENGIALKK